MRVVRIGVMVALGVLLAACGSTGTDVTSTEPGDGEDVREIPARILVEDVGAGEPWTTSRLTSPREVEPLAPNAEVDWENEVVLAFTLAESGSCPFGDLERVEYHEPHQRLYPVVPPAEDSEACTDDANPHTVVVAIAREDLPEGGFSIWVNGDEPPSGVTSGVTRFAPGELDGRASTPEGLDALGPDGDLSVGETKVAHDVTTHCGLNRIFRPIDGRQWVLNEEDVSPENLDYVPEEWRGVVTVESIDLMVERVEENVLRVTALDTDHTLAYVPAPDESGCD